MLMNPSIRQYGFKLLGFVCCFGIVLPGFSQDTQTAPRILFINSYHRGYSWSDGIEEGLRQQLMEADPEIELSIEFLDSRRFNYGKQIEYLAQAMAVKYTNYRPDLVIVADNAAFDFAMQYRQQLFANIPIVFCGYNSFRPDVLQGLSNITGVNEEIAIMNTVNMALQVHPQTDTLAFILSTGEESSQRIKKVAEQSILPELRQRFQVVTLEDASVREIEQRLASLPASTLLFLSGQATNQGPGRALSPVENGHLITQVSPFPAYTFWDFHLNHGAIGGRIITGPEQGKAAADLALRILAGESADAIPVVMETPTQVIFDYDVMVRFGIRPNDLPPDAQILNQPISIWTQYRWQIAGILALVTMQTLLIGLLLRLAHERRLALRTLDKERERLEERVAERTTELQVANAQLARLSTTDALTGLANRRQFDEVLRQEFLRMQRCHHPLSLIMLDVDHFKRFNDHYGHVAGDECLHRIGQAINQSVRHPPDLAARYGGEEFAIIFPETHFENAKGLAERIRTQIEQLQISHSVSDTANHVTVSLGVVTVEADTVWAPEEIVQLADKQLYRAKMMGRNLVLAKNLDQKRLHADFPDNPRRNHSL